MLCLWLLAGLVQTCLSGALYQQVPAQQLSTAEAHGPLARLALNSMGASGHLQYYSAPAPPVHVGSVPVAPVPFAAHAPFAPIPLAAHPPVSPFRLAASAPVASFPLPAPAPVASFPLPAPAPVASVNLVHHVPAVADVPITKYSAQPGYIQRVVDVARAKVATAKLQVRRPAIQKQFYDIEERTVVRPVGTAVVELEQPLSKKLVTPFTVVPSGHHTVAQYQPPLAHPVSSYPFVPYAPFQIPVQYYPPSVVQQPQDIDQSPQQQAPATPPPQQQAPANQPPQQPASQPPQQFPSDSQFSDASPDSSSPNNEFDSLDTVAVDNPDFDSSGIEGRRQPQPESEVETTTENVGQAQEQPDNSVFPQNTDLDQESMIQKILDEFQRRQMLRQFFRGNDLVPVPTPQKAQLFQPIRVQPFPQTITPQFRQIQQPSPPQGPQESAPAETSTSSQSDNSTESTTEDISSTTEAEFPTLSESPSDLVQNSTLAQGRSYFSEGQIASVRNLSPAEAQDNQQKLIELLTGREDISEIGLLRSGVKLSSIGDSGIIRARMLSVTPAPSTSDQSNERVSTRRVVVSRPIQTLEEVDVQQPFTQLARVAVHEPALLKTAHTQLTRVPAAVPLVSHPHIPLRRYLLSIY